MTYYLVRLDTKEIFEEAKTKPEKTQIFEHKNALNTDIMVIEGKVVITTEDTVDQPATSVDSIKVRAIDKVALAVVVRHDNSCPGQKPPGKPILEPPKKNRVVFRSGDIIEVNAAEAYSCKDDPTTPEILATGNKHYYIVAEGQPGAGQFCRKDKTEVVKS